jgi:hypothetical protein
MMLSTADLSGRWALTVDDRVVPIHNLFDGDGNLTTDPGEAVAFTAGDGQAIYAYAVSSVSGRVVN